MALHPNGSCLHTWLALPKAGLLAITLSGLRIDNEWMSHQPRQDSCILDPAVAGTSSLLAVPFIPWTPECPESLCDFLRTWVLGRFSGVCLALHTCEHCPLGLFSPIFYFHGFLLDTVLLDYRFNIDLIVFLVYIW